MSSSSCSLGTILSSGLIYIQCPSECCSSNSVWVCVRAVDSEEEDKIVRRVCFGISSNLLIIRAKAQIITTVSSSSHHIDIRTVEH